MNTPIASPLILIFAVTLFYPLFKLLWIGWRISPATVLSADPLFPGIVFFTYGQALLSALLSGVIGTWAAVLYSEREFPGRKLLWSLAPVCFSLPGVLVVLGLFGFWGARGWVSTVLAMAGLPPVWAPFVGWGPILMAHVFFNFPLFLRAVGTALGEMDRSTEMAALSLGASRWTCFRRVTWPKISPAWKSAFTLSFLYCSGSFLVVLLLGGGPRFTSLEVAVFQAVKVELDLGRAARLATLQMTVALAIYLLLLARPLPALVRGKFVPLYCQRSRFSPWIFAAFLFGLVGGPLLALLAAGLRGLFGVEWSTVAPSVAWSLALGVTVAVTTVVLAVPLAYLEKHWLVARRWVGAVSGLPLSLSSMIFTLGVLMAFPGLHRSGWGDALAVIWIQSVLSLPLAYRPIRDAFARIPSSLYQSAQSLGAGPGTIFRTVELPLLGHSLRLALVLVAGFSLGEVGSLLIFLSGESAPLPARIYRSMAQYRFDEAFGLGLVLVLCLGGLYWLIDRFPGRTKEGWRDFSGA
jgi:thiamine transport system permease protein